MRRKYYLAGPMTYRPQFNYPLFDRVSKTLRAAGYDIVSPAELDDPKVRAAALVSSDGAPDPAKVDGNTWGDFLSRDVKLIADSVQGIVLLPEWETSKGARLEAFVSVSLGHDLRKFVEKDGKWFVEPVYPLEVIQEITAALGV